MPTTNEIAKLLKDVGINVSRVHISEDPDVEDDSIQIDKLTHIQVGPGYMLIGVEKDGVFEFTPPLTLGDIINRLKGRIA